MPHASIRSTRGKGDFERLSVEARLALMVDLILVAYRPGKTIQAHLSGATSAVMTLNGLSGSESRPDLDAMVASGLIDQLVAALRAFEQRGVSGLQTTDIAAVNATLTVLRRSVLCPTAKSLVRSAGSAIAFAMEHSLDLAEELGWTSGGVAAALCED